ncbi:MAG: hypothetical protein HY728_03930 [Candidatus Rokubacteria bacterium]|nr:hypothetical protein [Candidatus Rokubacteria bacterium]
MLRFQGYQRDSPPPGPEVMVLFDAALAEGRRLMDPRAVVRWAGVGRQDGDTIDADGLRLTIPDVGHHWGPIERVAVVICTIGSALEQRVAARWAQRELPLAMMLDSVGSGAVESLAEYVNDLLCQEGVPLGLTVTNRVSPGYAAWDVGDQRRLFAFCPGDPIGVTLNEACFMTPTKSITFLVGAGPQARVDHYFSQCARCWMAACAYRRAPARRTVRRVGA